MNPALHCVLFDLDGVLVDYDRRVRVEYLAQAMGVAPEAVHAAIYASGIEEAGDSGALDRAGYLAALGAHIGQEVPATAWVAARRAATCVRPEVLALARALGSRVALGLLTNNGQLMADTLPQIVPELFPLFEGKAYTAAQFGAAKPDRAAYLGCIQALGVAPGHTLFVDDNAVNAEGARLAGLHAHHYRDLEGLRRALATFGLS
jgi:putative hydrolase of the HAD superfamily